MEIKFSLEILNPNFFFIHLKSSKLVQIVKELPASSQNIYCITYPGHIIIIIKALH